MRGNLLIFFLRLKTLHLTILLPLFFDILIDITNTFWSHTFFTLFLLPLTFTNLPPPLLPCLFVLFVLLCDPLFSQGCLDGHGCGAIHRSLSNSPVTTSLRTMTSFLQQSETANDSLVKAGTCESLLYLCKFMSSVLCKSQVGDGN